MTSRFQKLILILLLFANFLYASDNQKLTLGLTGVTLKEDVKSMLKLQQYLQNKTGFDINFKFTKSYAHIKNLLLNNRVDFAYICGSTYVDLQPTYKIQLLALPVVENKTTYKSLIITQKSKEYKNLFDLQNKIFAISDPESNSASLVPQYMIYKKGFNYDSFFKKVIVTYDHGETIDAVLSGYVDGGSVDSIVYRAFANKYPKQASNLKIVDAFGEFPIPPFVVRKSLKKETIKKLADAFIMMQKDVLGREILSSLAIDRFTLPDHISYQKIEDIKKYLKKQRFFYDK